MLDFGALPPEINSGRMYSGPGSGPLLVAAAAWDALAEELGGAAAGYHSVISDLASAPWQGPASTSMVVAVAPYVSWLSSVAAEAEQTASQMRAAVAAYEAAFAMTVPPPVIAANRVLLMTLIATNFFGQNTPAIAATEAQYAEMWLQDAAAMYGYAGASAAAATVTPFAPPKQTANPAGLAGQAAAVAKAAATPAGASAQTTATAPQLASHLASATAVPHALQQLSSAPVGSPVSSTSPLSWVAQQIDGLTPGSINAVVKQTLQAYFGVGLVQFFASIAQQLVPGTAGGAGAAGSAPLPGAGLPALSSLGFSGGSVSATFGQANLLGPLSVPPSWAPGVATANPTAQAASLSAAQAASRSGPGGLLRGMPLTAAAGRRGGGGFVHRYGFRYSAVPPRPPCAG